MGIPSQPFSASGSTTGADLLAIGIPSNGSTTDDPVETYFECITACSIDDGECVTQCVEVLRSADT